MTFGRPLDLRALMDNGGDEEAFERITIALQNAVADAMGDTDAQR